MRLIKSIFYAQWTKIRKIKWKFTVATMFASSLFWCFLFVFSFDLITSFDVIECATEIFTYCNIFSPVSAHCVTPKPNLCKSTITVTPKRFEFRKHVMQCFCLAWKQFTVLLTFPLHIYLSILPFFLLILAIKSNLSLYKCSCKFFIIYIKAWYYKKIIYDNDNNYTIIMQV